MQVVQRPTWRKFKPAGESSSLRDRRLQYPAGSKTRLRACVLFRARLPLEAQLEGAFTRGQHGPRCARILIDDGAPGLADALDHVLDLALGDLHLLARAELPAAVRIRQLIVADLGKDEIVFVGIDQLRLKASQDVVIMGLPELARLFFELLAG